MAGKVVDRLVTELTADRAKMRSDLDKSIQDTQAWGRRVGNIVKTTVGAIGVGFAVRAIVRATAEQEAAMTQLQQTLISTNEAVGLSFEELTEQAAEFQRRTTFGDEEIIRAQSQLATFTRITGDEFNRATEAALDLSTKMDNDLKGAIQQVGKALNDPIKGVSALAESGIQFTESQRDMIRALVETGREADAQRIILEELETQFGGSAEAARDTFGGALESLNNAFGDLLESGNTEKTIASVEKLTEALSDERTVEGANVITGAVFSLGEVTARSLAEAAIAADDFADRFEFMLGTASRADEIKLELAAINQALDSESPTPLKLFFVSDGELKQRKENFLAELDSIKAAQKGAVEAAEETGEANRQLFSVDQALPKILVDGLKAQAEAAKEAEKELQKLNDAAGTELERLQRKAATLGDTTELQKLQFELEQGRLQGLAPDRKQELVDAALKLDLLEEERQAREAFQQQFTSDLERASELRRAALSDEERALEDLKTQFAEVRDLVAGGFLAPAEGQDITAAIKADFDDLSDKAEETETELSEFSRRAAENMQDAFADFLFDPFEDGLDGMLRNFGNVLRRMAAEAAAADIFNSLTNDSGGLDLGGIASGVASLFGGGGNATASAASDIASIGQDLFGGAYADGGRPPRGKISLVGERGPELFAPDISGTVIPLSETGGGRSVNNINMTFPGISNAREAERAAGAAGRKLAGQMDKARRYG